MLNFIKKLFGATDAKVEVQPVQAEVAQPKALEFHEEIRAQVDAEKASNFPVKKPAAKKPAAKKAPAKATAKKAPAKKKSK
jgi:DNA topoisomerase-1